MLKLIDYSPRLSHSDEILKNRKFLKADGIFLRHSMQINEMSCYLSTQQEVTMEDTMIPVAGIVAVVLVPLALFAMIVLIVYFGLTKRHALNVELIKRGINPAKYDIKLPGRLGLPVGVILLAIGLGAVVSILVTGEMSDPDAFWFFLACLFGGIGMIIYWKMTASDRERALKIKEDLILKPGPDFQPNAQIEQKPEE